MSPEKKPAPRESFKWRDRTRLLDQALAKASWYRSNLVFNGPHLDPYAELLAFTDMLLTEDLLPRARGHLTKMGALEARQLPPPTKEPGDVKFWDETQALLGRSWETAQSFPEDLSDVPKTWERARDDLFLLHSALREER